MTTNIKNFSSEIMCFDLHNREDSNGTPMLELTISLKTNEAAQTLFNSLKENYSPLFDASQLGQSENLPTVSLYVRNVSDKDYPRFEKLKDLFKDYKRLAVVDIFNDTPKQLTQVTLPKLPESFTEKVSTNNPKPPIVDISLCEEPKFEDLNIQSEVRPGVKNTESSPVSNLFNDQVLCNFFPDELTKIIHDYKNAQTFEFNRPLTTQSPYGDCDTEFLRSITLKKEGYLEQNYEQFCSQSKNNKPRLQGLASQFPNLKFPIITFPFEFVNQSTIHTCAIKLVKETAPPTDQIIHIPPGTKFCTNDFFGDKIEFLGYA